MVYKLLLLFLSLTNTSEISNEIIEPCCEGKCDYPKLKYYRIGEDSNYCEEACINPSYESIFKIFGLTLKKLNATHYPCHYSSYTIYNSTINNGFYPFEMKFDVYNKMGVFDWVDVEYLMID